MPIKLLTAFLITACLLVIVGLAPRSSKITPDVCAQTPFQRPFQGNAQQFQSGTGHYATGANSGQENVLIILDASYSMAEPLSHRETKMAIAKRTIFEVTRSVPANVNLGLRVYGDSDRASIACRATTLLVPMGKNNRNLIAGSLVNVRPTGATPISHAIQTAIHQDFYNLPGKKTIILVSDGIETCGADPCDVAVNMMRNGIDVKINVVGFGIHDFDATRQLKCVALSTYGKFYTANTAAELGKSLTDSMDIKTSVEGKVLTQPSFPATKQQTPAASSQPRTPKSAEKEILATPAKKGSR